MHCSRERFFLFFCSVGFLSLSDEIEREWNLEFLHTNTKQRSALAMIIGFSSKPHFHH